MKKVLSIMALAIALVLTSCGGKKEGASFDGNKLINNPTAITKALERPATRASGSATQFDLGFATRSASAAARQALAAQIMQVISSNNTMNNYSYSQFASDGREAGNAKDEEQKNQEMMEAIVAEIPINGAAVIENNIYKTKDGQYQVFVCVEFQGDAMTLANNMAEGYRKYLQQRVSEEKRAQIDQRVEDFREQSLKRIREINNI